MPEAAIDHAQQAGDADRVARSCSRWPTPSGPAAARHGAALDGVVLGQRPDRAAPGRRGPRCADLRADRARGRRRTVGDGGRAHHLRGHAAGREHDGGLARLPAGARCAAMAWTRCATTPAAALGGAQPDQPLPRHDAARRGRRPTCSKATSIEADVFFSRAVDEAVQRRRRARSSRSCWPSGASWPSSVTTGRRPTSSPRRRWPSCGQRAVRRLLDQCARLRLGGEGGVPAG